MVRIITCSPWGELTARYRSNAKTSETGVLAVLIVVVQQRSRICTDQYNTMLTAHSHLTCCPEICPTGALNLCNCSTDSSECTYLYSVTHTRASVKDCLARWPRTVTKTRAQRYVEVCTLQHSQSDQLTCSKTLGVLYP